MAAEPDYAKLLRSAIKAAGSSRRKLSTELPAKTGNLESTEYRALGKYLAGDETPNRERAAIIAVLLGEPRLALISSRRDDRLAKVEEKVDGLRGDFDRFVRSISERRVEHEEDQALPTHPVDRPSSPGSK